MTEQEWLACTDPEPMLEFLRGKATDRKLRLFACACCRHTGSFADDELRRLADNTRSSSTPWLSRVACWISSGFRPPWWRSGEAEEMAKKEIDLAWRAAEVAEKVADGLTGLAELTALLPSHDELEEIEYSYAGGSDAAWAAKSSAYRARWCAQYTTIRSYPPGAGSLPPSELDYEREQSAQGHLLRDIFGNPFRPVAVDPTWLTTAVVELAQAIYDGWAFDRLPSLADALGQAGCTNGDILAHCRQPGEHMRGCWVVDLLLGKT